MNRSFISRLLAVVLATLMAPDMSWMQRGRGPFQAHAQAPVQLQSCGPATPNLIIQNYCGNGPLTLASLIYASDVAQLETDAVNAYLGFHGLPATDAHLIYDSGRQDLRNGVRAGMYAIMAGIISKPAPQRSTHEQNLYKWLQGMVQNNEINLYTQALQNFNSFRSDPCHFTLDGDLAKAYNISYDGTIFCFGGLQSSIFGANVPSAAYFKGYGMKFSYGAKSLTDPSFAPIVADSALSAGEFAGITLAAAAVIGAAAGGILGSSVASAAAAFAVSGYTGSLAAANSTFVISGLGAASGIGIGLAVIGPVLIIVLAIAMIGIAAYEVFNNQKELDEINDMNNTLSQVTNTPPDLLSFLNDSSGLGAYKLQTTLYSQTVPDVPSTATLPTHQPNDMSFTITRSTGITQITDTLQYEDWSHNQWTVQTSGGWFVRTCTQGPNSTTPCQQTKTEGTTNYTIGENDSITGDLHYLDWTSTQRTASRVQGVMVSTKANPSSTDQVCPADAVTGVTIPKANNVPADLSQCISYTASTLPMLDQNGNRMTVGLTTLSAPGFFTPAPILSYSIGTPATLTINVGGNPTPRVCWDNGLVHDGFDASVGTCQSGPFRLTYDGVLTDPTGSFTLQLTATNSLGSVTQSFTVNVADVLNILTPGTLTGVAGEPMNLTIVATGKPTPTLSYNGFDLPGLTFHDNGNGTATLSGTYTGTTLVRQCLAGFGSQCGGFVATNSQGTFTQVVSIDFSPSPGASPSPGSVTFTAGVKNVALLSSVGAVTPVNWATFFLPSWLTLTDLGDGTAMLSGTPPAETNQTFTPDISPHALGSGCDCAFPYTVNVVDVPVFTSANTATFTVGSGGSFSITANDGTIATSDTLPQGLAFSAGNPATISGTSAVGSGGQYGIHLTTSATSGTTTQDLTLNVNEATQITSPNLVTLFAGQPASFAVNALGYPSESQHAVAANAGPPADPSQGDGTYFAVSGLPQNLQASNLNLGLATGTLTISGTPQSGDIGTHKVQITAENGVGTPAQQTLILEVYPYSTSPSVNLVTSFVLSRDASHDVVATVVVANNSNKVAQNVAITSAKIGSVAGTISPAEVASVAPASTATFTVVFPAASMGAPGTAGLLSLSGSYTGGTISSGGRFVLP